MKWLGVIIGLSILLAGAAAIQAQVIKIHIPNQEIQITKLEIQPIGVNVSIKKCISPCLEAKGKLESICLPVVICLPEQPINFSLGEPAINLEIPKSNLNFSIKYTG